ncbi:MAG TPA: hypothetical protein VK684_01905 [Edaphobacter sp.]|jgi:hypothetical protein|nr:hypothetical protein [Edaphobacter sp.]
MELEHFEEFEPSHSGASESILKQIVFLRDSKDHRQCGEMTNDCFESFVKFLEKQWTDFSVVYRAAQRNPTYFGLLQTLTKPAHQDFYPGWEVHWRIGLLGGVANKSSYELDEYRLMVELIRQH